jgi:peptide/nickel transport system substrate-binding protein
MLGGTAAAGLGVAALALTGCGDDDSSGGKTTTANGSAPAGATGTPVQGGTTDESKVDKSGIIHYRQGGPWASINPYKGLDSGLTWGFTILDPLFYTPADTGVREMFLGASVEQQDPTHYTIKLKDANFHNVAPVNGRAVKAADVKATYELQRDSKTVSKGAWWNSTFDSITAVDDKTVNVVLKAVDAWTFSSTNSGSPIAGIIPEEMAKNPDSMDTNVIGSGRYQYVSADNGTNMKMKRFDNWRIKGEPWLAGIEYKLIQEQAQALAAFQAKQIDQVAPNNKLERDDLVSKLGKDIAVESQITGANWILQSRADGAFKDLRVNRAISEALDTKQFIDLMNFGDGVPSGPVPAKFPAHVMSDADLAATYGKFDVADAKALLSASGFDTSKEYGLKYITPGDRYAQFGQIVQSQLKQNLGINIKLIGEDFGKWLSQSLYGSDYDAFITFPNLDYDDPSSYLFWYLKDQSGRQNSARFFNDELDGLVLKQKTILDDKARAQAVIDVQKKAWEVNAPTIPVFTAISSTATWGYVKGRTLNRGSYGLFSGRTYIDKS